MSESGQQFITFKQADKIRQRLLIGYPEFREWDRPHQQPIMAEAKAIMEAWFERGVRYGMGFLLPPGIMAYTNAPLELRRSLEVARGKILINILEWRGVPKDMGAQLLMVFRAIPSAESGLKREINAAFERRLFPLPYGTVFETRHLHPRERTEIVSDNWYDLQSQELYSFVSESYTTKGDEWRARSTRAIEKKLDLEQRLKDLGLSQTERYIYYACRHFHYKEVAEFSAMIGHNMSPEAIRKLNERIKERLN